MGRKNGKTAVNGTSNTATNINKLKDKPNQSKKQLSKPSQYKLKNTKTSKSKIKKNKENSFNSDVIIKFREKLITNLSNCIQQFENDYLTECNSKIKDINKQLKNIQSKPSEVFVDQIDQLNQIRDYKLYEDEVNKKYKLHGIEEEYKNLLIKAEDKYRNENDTVRKRLLGYVQDKRNRLRDEMNNMEISEEYTVEIPNRSHPQTRRSKKKEEELNIIYNKVPKIELNPKTYILRPDQVLEDMDIFYHGNGHQMVGKRGRNLRNGKK